MKDKSNKLFIKITTLLLLLTLIFINLVYAEPSSQTLSTQDELDQYIQMTVKKLGIPGMSVAISHKGNLIYNETFGKDIEKNTRFYIGSISKSFTSLAIMQLVEQEKIDLDASVSNYLEDFTVSDKITVRHLLHHVSGMTENDYNSWGSLPPESDFSALVQDMNAMTLSFPPGEHFSYFNPNYSLLGYIIEIVSGQSYIDYMAEYILEPLGLNNTSLTGELDTIGHLSFFGFSIKRPEQYVTYDLPAGYITSTAEDLIIFLDAIRMKQPITGVSPQGIENMITGNSYGMGWMNSKVSNRPAVHHGGSLPGFTSNAVMLIDDEYSIAILMNKNHLLKGIIFYPDFTQGIVSILTQQEPPYRVKYFWIYRLLILFFALTIITNIRKFIKMIFHPQEKTIKWRIKAALINLAIPILLLILIPIVAGIVTMRGMTWTLAFLLLPDMILWLFIGVATHLIQSGIHISFIVKNHNKGKNLIS